MTFLLRLILYDLLSLPGREEDLYDTQFMLLI
jgi:hypothetical protein